MGEPRGRFLLSGGKSKDEYWRDAKHKGHTVRAANTGDKPVRDGKVHEGKLKKGFPLCPAETFVFIVSSKKEVGET